MAFKYIGTSSTTITDGGVENPTINGVVVTTKNEGDIVFYTDKRFLWTSNAWKYQGDINTHTDVQDALNAIMEAYKGEEVRGSIYDAIALIDTRSNALEIDIRNQASDFIEEEADDIVHDFIGNLCVRFDLDNNTASKTPVNIQNELGNNRTILANVKYDGVYRYGMTCKVNIVGPELNNMHVIAFAPLSDGSNIEIFDIAFGAPQSGIIVSYNRTLVPISGGGGGSYTEGDGIDINNDEISVKLRSSNPGLAFTNDGELYATGSGGSYSGSECISVYNNVISLLYGYGLTVEYDSLNDIYELVPDYTYVQQKLDAGIGIAIRPGTGASSNPVISILPGTFMPYYAIGDGLTVEYDSLDDTSTLAVDFSYINTLITLPIAASGTTRAGKLDYINTTYASELEFRQVFGVSLEKLLDISSKKDVSNITLFANQTASGTYPTYFTVDNIQHDHSVNLWDTFVIYFSGVNESTTGMQSFMLTLGFYYTSGEISTISAQIAPYITYQKKLTEGTGIDISSNGTVRVDTTTIQGKLTTGPGISIDANNEIDTFVVKIGHLDVTSTPTINHTFQELYSRSDTAYGEMPVYLWYSDNSHVYTTAVGTYTIGNGGATFKFYTGDATHYEYRQYSLTTNNELTMTSRSTEVIQTKLTSTNAGTGISITNDAQGNPVISLDLPQAEGGGF